MKRFPTIILFLTLVSSSLFASAPSDSLSYYLGKTQGAMIKRQLASMPMADSRFRDGLLSGLASVLDVDTANVGYTEGIQMGLAMLGDLTKFRRLGAQIDNKELYAALRQSLLSSASSNDSVIRAENVKVAAMLAPYMQRAKELEEAQRAAQNRAYDSICTANLEAGEAFLDSLKRTDRDVKFLDSGLAYKVITKGKGPHPNGNDMVDVIYTGTTIDGRVFDSSNGEPVAFNVNGVIRGFSEGLAMMNKGAHYIFYIPGELAYGAKGIPGQIEPEQLLIFDVELTEIKK